MNPITPNNSDYSEWSVEPHDSTVADSPAERYLHATGRVEIVIEPVEQSYWDTDAEESKTRVAYPVNVYESTNYDYHNDEYIDHTLVATVRPGTSGSQMAYSFRMAQTLALNAILAIQLENKWLAKPLDNQKQCFVSPSLDKEDAFALYRELVVEHSGGLDPQTREDALKIADELGWDDLAEYIFSLDDDMFAWLLMDPLPEA